MELETAVVYPADSNGSISAHPVHRYWVGTIDATELVIRQHNPPSYLGESFLTDIISVMNLDCEQSFDVYLFESPGSLYAAPLIHRHDPTAIKLYLHTSWRLQGSTAHNWDDWPLGLCQLAQLERTVDAKLLSRVLNRYIDGVITVSEMVAQSVTEVFDGPVRIVRPFITPEVENELSEVKPDLDSQTMVVVGKARGHKGIDILVDAWSQVRETHSDARLRIIGDGHSPAYDQLPGITVDGYIPRLADVFSSAAGYVHPARFDASPVSTLEALYAGLPTIVTESTGTRSEAGRLGRKCVVPTTEAGVAAGVISYLDLTIDERVAMSEQAHVIGAEFRRSERASEFSDEFTALVDDLRR